MIPLYFDTNLRKYFTVPTHNESSWFFGAYEMGINYISVAELLKLIPPSFPNPEVCPTTSKKFANFPHSINFCSECNFESVHTGYAGYPGHS